MDIDRSDNNNELLLIQIKQGYRESFDILYNKYWDKAYSKAYKRLQDSDQAKDLVQEIFINIWYNDTVIDNFEAYLNSAIRNQVFRIVAEGKKKSPFLDALYDIPSSAGADYDITRKELYKKCEHFISNLPPKRQHIFRMHFNEDQPTKAIAEQMGITRKTVQNQLGKAIEYLRVVLLPCFILMVILFGK